MKWQLLLHHLACLTMQILWQHLYKVQRSEIITTYQREYKHSSISCQKFMWLIVNWIRQFFKKRDIFSSWNFIGYLWIHRDVQRKKKKKLKEVAEEITVGRHGRRVQTQMVTVCIYSQGNITRQTIWCWGNSVAVS